MYHRGFTLLETLLVLILIATLAAVLAPAIVSTPGSDFRQASTQARAALRHARLIAMRERRDAVLLVNTRLGRVDLKGSDHSLVLPPGIKVQLTTAESEMLGEDQGGIRFFPDGSSTGGRITLSASDRIQHLDVAWLTGRVTQQEGEL